MKPWERLNFGSQSLKIQRDGANSEVICASALGDPLVMKLYTDFKIKVSSLTGPQKPIREPDASI